MKNTSDILQQLAALSANDRHWIVERLSPGSRKALLGDAAPRLLTGRRSAANAALAAAMTKLDAATAGSIVAVVAGEPAWVVHALLQSSPWPWREAVMRQLPAARRDAVMGLNAAGVHFSAKLIDDLLMEVAQLVEGAPRVETLSPFQAWIKRMGASLSRQPSLRIRA
jgi:hypothetical protein